MITLLTDMHVRMRMLEAFATRDHTEPSIYGVLDFIFDDNPKMAAIVPKYYQKIREQMHPLFQKWIAAASRFEDDHDFLPLQACDAQSWYFRRLFAEKFQNESFKPDLPKSCFAALDGVQGMMSFFSPERMRNAVAKAPAIKKPQKRFENIHDLLANGDLGENE